MEESAAGMVGAIASRSDMIVLAVAALVSFGAWCLFFGWLQRLTRKGNKCNIFGNS